MAKSPTNAPDAAPKAGLAAAVAAARAAADTIRQGGGPGGIERQHRHGRLTARERIAKLLDPGTSDFEVGLFAAHGMYREYGGAPSAGVVTTIGSVDGRRCLIVATAKSIRVRGSRFLNRPAII